jgi:DNA invertase Pin-like site-specific DNA recombinase
VKIAIYARVSTTKQDNENQLAQLREFAAKQDWQVFDSYVDQESGSTSDRPEFQRMFCDASKRKFDLVLFWALDRFSRQGVLDTLQHFNRLESYGVSTSRLPNHFSILAGSLRTSCLRLWPLWRSRSGSSEPNVLAPGLR